MMVAMLVRQLKSLQLEVVESTKVVLVALRAKPPIYEEIERSQDLDLELKVLKEKVKKGQL